MTIANHLAWGVLIVMLLFSARKSNSLALLCAAALIVRILAGLSDQLRILRLPWSGADSEAFYRTSLDFAAMPLAEHLSHFSAQFADVYPWLLGFVVKVFGSNYFFLRSLNFLLGVYTVVIVYRLANVFQLPARKKLAAAAVFAFFPFSIILSSVLLREAIIALLFLNGFISSVLFFKTGRLSSLFASLFYFFISSIFHGGMAVAFIMMILIATISKPESDGQGKLAVQRGLISIRRLIAISISTTILLFIALGGYQFSKIGNVSAIAETVDARVSRVENNGAKGEAGYPAWLTENTANPLFLPIRVLYFLGGPLPWDIRDLTDLAASIVSLFYLYMVYCIIGIWRSSRWFMFSCILLGTVVLAFAVGTDNFGTAIRHRNKFLAPIIVMFYYSRMINAATRHEISSSSFMSKHIFNA